MPAEVWRELLQQLSAELEMQSAAFQELDAQHTQLLESWTLQGLNKPELSHSPLSSMDVRPVQAGKSSPGLTLPKIVTAPELPINDINDQMAESQKVGKAEHLLEEVSIESLKDAWKRRTTPGEQKKQTLARKENPGKSWSLAITAALPVVPGPEQTHEPKRADLRPKQQNGVHFTLMRAQRTKQFSFAKPWYVISPGGQLGTVWQIVIAIALAFVAFITPVQVGLLPLQFDSLLVVSLCIDGLFFIDTIMQFFIMYKVKTAHGFVWEPRLKKIAWHYVCTWFPVDLVTLIPFDLLSLASETDRINNLKGLKVLRALRLLKLMRLVKSSSIMHKIEISLAMPYHHLALCRFLAFLLFYCHWLACIWAMCLQLVDQQFPQWIDQIARSDLEYGISTRDSAWRVYVTSFYFCSYTLTSVGYGDLGPKNILERIVCTGMVLTAGIAWAYILGQVCAIVTDITEDSIRWRKQMHQLNTMTKERRFPTELGTRLRSWFVHNRTLSLYMVQQKLLENMSPQLQAEVCTELNLRWMNKVPFFRDFSLHIADLEEKGMHTLQHRLCIADISRQLQCTAFAQAESFETEQLHILSRGLVALNHRVGFDGAVWGEDFVLQDLSLIRPVTCYALTYIEVLFLTRDNFIEVIERRQRQVPELGRIVRRYCVRMAVCRGVMAEARRRLDLRKQLAEDGEESTDILRTVPSFG